MTPSALSRMKPLGNALISPIKSQRQRHSMLHVSGITGSKSPQSRKELPQESGRRGSSTCADHGTFLYDEQNEKERVLLRRAREKLGRQWHTIDRVELFRRNERVWKLPVSLDPGCTSALWIRGWCWISSSDLIEVVCNHHRAHPKSPRSPNLRAILEPNKTSLYMPVLAYPPTLVLSLSLVQIP